MNTPFDDARPVSASHSDIEAMGEDADPDEPCSEVKMDERRDVQQILALREEVSVFQHPEHRCKDHPRGQREHHQVVARKTPTSKHRLEGQHRGKQTEGVEGRVPRVVSCVAGIARVLENRIPYDGGKAFIPHRLRGDDQSNRRAQTDEEQRPEDHRFQQRVGLVRKGPTRRRGLGFARRVHQARLALHRPPQEAWPVGAHSSSPDASWSRATRSAFVPPTFRPAALQRSLS